MPHRPRPTLPALLALWLPACNGASGGETSKDPDPPRLVRAAPAELRLVRRELRTTGFLESELQAAVTTRVSGRLQRLHVDVGARVRAGDVLAELDDREAASAVEQLQAQLAARRVDLELARLEIESAGRRVSQAALEAQRTQAEYARQAEMDPEFVAPKALQEAELAAKGAAQAQQVAQFNERKARLEVTRNETGIGELEARIREVRVRLEDHRIAAPFDGLIVRRHVAQGAMLAAGQNLFDLVDPDRLVAWFDRPQAELDLCRSAREALFVTDALPGQEFGAEVDLVGPVVDRDTGHFRVRVRVRSQDVGRLLPGMFLRARILTEAEREALMVPKIAVLAEGEVAVVMAVRNGKACRVDLDPGLELQDRVECRNRGDAGLQPGDLVVVSGHEDLKDQSTVEVAQD
jgi:RND family efflux transporter MFP subunit